MVAVGAILPGSHEVNTVEPIKKSPDTEVIDGQIRKVLASTELSQHSTTHSKLERHASDEAVSLTHSFPDVYEGIASPTLNHESEVKTNLEQSRLEMEIDTNNRAAGEEKQNQNTDEMKSYSAPSEKSSGRNNWNIPGSLGRRINFAKEWLRQFKIDWDQMQEATAPQPDPPDREKQQVTMKK